MNRFESDVPPSENGRCFDKTLTAQDGTNLIDYWTKQGFCRYVDDKKITDWSTIARVQFPIEVFQSVNNNILTKLALVNERANLKVMEKQKEYLISSNKTFTDSIDNGVPPSENGR